MEPVINCEEEIGKTVGRRRPRDPLSTACLLNETIADLREGANISGGIPRGGVYRFKTHEEADEWMVKMQAQRGMAKKS